jgi:hypothetical protein
MNKDRKDSNKKRDEISQYKIGDYIHNLQGREK